MLSRTIRCDVGFSKLAYREYVVQGLHNRVGVRVENVRLEAAE